MARNIGAFVAGFLVVGVVVAGLQAISAQIFPLPEGFDPTDAEALARHTATLPAGAWAMAFGSEIVGAFLGALTAGRIAGSHRKRFAAAIVGLALLGSILNWTSFPHPLWFVVGQLVAYPVALWAAVGLLPPARSEPPTGPTAPPPVSGAR